MRIQHNIPALNAYRNYTSNTTAVSKSLEKLSSGYRINRAGDDAAGLAISEKMRAQITGLKAANKNAKDGISLVQTAEGALTEVHSMLNRMVDLAQQSANGTFDNDVDRANLMKEFTKLNEEIDRIADSTNFNGIKLLNGDLSSGGGSTAGVAGKLAMSDAVKAAAGGYVAATQAKSDIKFTTATGAYADDDVITLKVAGSDGNIHSVDLTVDATNKKLIGADGAEYSIANAATITDAELADAFAAELGEIDGLSDKFTFDTTTTSGTLSIISKDKGANAATIEMSSMTTTSTTGNATAAAVAVTKGDDAFETLDISDYLGQVGASGWDKTGTVDAKDAIFDINGQKFAVAADAASAAELVKQFGQDVNIVMFNNDDDDTAADLVNQINAKTGLSTDLDATDTNKINLKGTPGTTTPGTGGLTLQIGDTSESFNKLTVSVGDMHSAALGIASLNIGNQDGASAAVAKLKDAINQVSSTRGELGATQNRLEHTRNNLSVTTENITDAEASIRDVDIAEEMMAYTKNNILVQSAQAMLAQANQMPQGVLQLLQ